jgi:hypothetical protein
MIISLFKKFISISKVKNSIININFFGLQNNVNEKNVINKKIKKNDLNESDKIKFINDFTFHELVERHLVEEIEKEIDDSTSQFYFKKNKTNITDVIFRINKIILLGNPGIGKSTELKKLAENIWVDKNNELIPVFRNLKNFTKISSMEDFVILNYKSYENLLFILDGVDEIVDIEDFISKLENFIFNNEKIKIVISCRTNVFQKFVKNIFDFKAFRLEDLTFEQGKKLLNKKINYNIDFDIHDNNLVIDFLKNPFQINLLADYINRNRSLPNNNLVLWESYIESRLSNDRNDKFKRTNLNIPIIKKCSSKISLINELMKSNLITEENIFDALNEMQNNFGEFLKTPFLDKNTGKEEYFFEHRNIQEYFAALLLSKHSFEKILNIILIKDSNKIHPSLNNTVTFLINILEGETFGHLLSWLIVNEPEILFKADKNRISNFTKRVFQDYFTNHCVNKTFWINTKSSLTVKEIAEFADSIDNYNFLINHIKENKHFRVVVSAIEILSFFNLNSINKVDETKHFFIEILKNEEYSIAVKSSVVNCIGLQLFTKNDISYLDSILSIFKESSNKELNRAILSLLIDENDIDRYFEFIYKEFLFENNIVEREIDDKVLRGTNYVIIKLIINLKDSNNFIKIVKYFFDHNNRFYVSEYELKEIVDKSLEFDKKNPDFTLRLLKELIDKKDNFYFENELNDLITNSTNESKFKVIEYLLSNYSFNEISHELSLIVDDKTIDIVVDFLIEKLETEPQEIEIFKNRLSNKKDRSLGKYFYQKFKDLGFIFKEKWYSDHEIQKYREDFKNKPQENFNLLFKRDKLLDKIKEIFNDSNERLDIEMYFSIEKNWYKINGHSQRIDTSYEIVRTILAKSKKTLNYDELISYINDNFIINEIINDIENFGKNKLINIDHNQLKFITDWVKKSEVEIDFNSVIDYQNYDRFSLKNDYKKWENIIFFLRKLEVDISDDFLLNSLNLSYVRNFNEEESLFIFLTNKINSREALRIKVVQNLKDKKFNSFIALEHIKYALNNKIEESYQDVKSLLLEDEIKYNLSETLKKYYELTNDISFLKECAANLESQKAWDVINIILDNKIDNDFVRNLSIQYIESLNNDSMKYYLANSLNTLFKLNDSRALKYYMNHFKDEYNNSLQLESYNNFNAIENFQDLLDIFDAIYLDKNFERSFNSASNVLNQCIINLSSNENTYTKIHEILIIKREELNFQKDDNGIFFINILIDLCENSYYTSMSKPLDFKEALKKVEEILN